MQCKGRVHTGSRHQPHDRQASSLAGVPMQRLLKGCVVHIHGRRAIREVAIPSACSHLVSFAVCLHSAAHTREPLLLSMRLFLLIHAGIYYYLYLKQHAAAPLHGSPQQHTDLSDRSWVELKRAADYWKRCQAVWRPEKTTCGLTLSDTLEPSFSLALPFSAQKARALANRWSQTHDNFNSTG